MVLVDVQLQAQSLVIGQGLGSVALVRLVP